LSSWSRFTHKDSEATASSPGGQEEEVVEFEMERKLMHERNQEINVVSRSIMNVHNILQETGVMVHEQGEQLDAIGEELFTTYRNANLARENVTEANESQQRARRKYVYLSMLILVVLAVAAILVFV
jgi:t-SNARE complex subunit (syntaxin)